MTFHNIKSAAGFRPMRLSNASHFRRRANELAALTAQGRLFTCRRCAYRTDRKWIAEACPACGQPIHQQTGSGS